MASVTPQIPNYVYVLIGLKMTEGENNLGSYTYFVTMKKRMMSFFI